MVTVITSDLPWIKSLKDKLMGAHRTSSEDNKSTRLLTLTVRLDRASKTSLTKAAKLRGISVSEYVRTVAVQQARRDIVASQEGVILLTTDGQRAFWKLLNRRPKLTSAQRKLGAVMRGEL
jgi:uncharacterized protein (DUF1778 family)